MCRLTNWLEKSPMSNQQKTRNVDRKEKAQSLKEDFNEFVSYRQQFRLTIKFLIELRNLQSRDQKCKVNTNFHIELSFVAV